MVTRYKYIHFKVVEKKAKTKVWGCFNNNSVGKLGEVRWYSAWRRYCYFPKYETVYSADCLEDITKFTKRLNELHAKSRKRDTSDKRRETNL